MTPPPLTPSDLCAAFREQASAVHRLVAYSYSCDIGVSEEAITDVMLVEMHHRLAPYVVTKKFTKNEESSVSGADWLWTIGRPGRWLSLLVQAKLARPRQDRLVNLHHGKGTQRKTLVQYARQESCVPLYVVYSSFDGQVSSTATGKPRAGRPRKSAVSWEPSCPLAAEDITQMGCVAVRPRHVALMDRSKGDRESVIRLLSAGNPWACLFCCPGPNATGDLADAVAGGIGRLPIDSPNAKSPGGSGTSEPDDVFELNDTFISHNPPAIVADLLAGREHDGQPPVSAVVVISSEPLNGPPTHQR